jgi:hypothetical protein
MGVIDLYFVDNEVEVRCRRKVVDCACYWSTTNLSFIIECTTNASDVRTSGTMGGYLADHRLQSLLSSCNILSTSFYRVRDQRS